MIGLLLVATSLSLMIPARAEAMDRDLRSVLVAGGYGMVAGTVAGALTLPITQNARTMFVGTSLGLYLGIVVGIYYVLDKDNPLRLRPEERPSRGELRFTDQELRAVASNRVPHLIETRAAADQLTRVDVAVLRF